MKKQKLVNFKELTKLSNKLGESLDTLKTIEPFIKFEDRYKYKRTYKFIDELYWKVEKLIINITDSTELDNE
jgi:hypothetical protein